MSFGRPANFNPFSKPLPPERGSFPLDHFGECKDWMNKYMKCMKDNKMSSHNCRPQAKDYLECRMQKGLMEKDEMKNLGFIPDQQQQQQQEQEQGEQKEVLKDAPKN